MNLSPEEFESRMKNLKHKTASLKAPSAKKPVDAQEMVHKKKFVADQQRAKVDLAESKKQFEKELSDVRGNPDLSIREKQRKMIGMKQDFMAKVSDLKERMGLDPRKTDRMAWKQAQLKKNQRPINV